MTENNPDFLIFTRLRDDFNVFLEQQSEKGNATDSTEYDQAVSKLKTDTVHAIEVFDKAHEYRNTKSMYHSIKLIKDICAHFGWKLEDDKFGEQYDFNTNSQSQENQ